MTENQNNIKKFMEAAGQFCPDKPRIPTEETLKLRLTLLLEELLELTEASGYNLLYVDGTPSFIKDPEKSINLVEMVDAIGDINYVNYGFANTLGVDMEPIDKEIQRSNMSKFIDGYRRDDGKWVKGPSYSPANLQPIIDEQLG